MTKRKPEGWRKTPAQRFWEKVDKTEGCWLWTGGQAGRGWRERKSYGVFGLRAGKNIYAHRYAYEQLVGPIPEGMTLDHRCRVKSCVNPDHLEVVTAGENLRRSMPFRERKTHCPKGHPYSGDNVTYWGDNPSARCVTCERERYYRTYPLPSGKRKPRKNKAA